MRMIALDAALAHTGWSVIESDGTVGDWGVIDSSRARAATPLAHLARLGQLRSELITLLQQQDAGRTGTFVVIEKTDWSRGRRDSRESWVVETGAREALAIGFTVAAIVCLELDIQPIVLGPRQWMSKLGVGNKDGAAVWVVAHWSNRFTLKLRERGGRRPSTRWVVVERVSGVTVPDHVTDALAMGYVAIRQRGDPDVGPERNGVAP